MFRIGKSTSGMNLNKETFETLKKAGFDAVEVSYPVGGYENINYEELGKIAAETGIELWSYHIPFSPFDIIDISDVNKVDYTVKYASELIEKAAAIGIKKFTIHPSAEPMTEDQRPARIACAKEGLARLAEFAKTKGAIICVESLPRTCLGRDSSDITELLSAHQDLRCCFDTNHLLYEDPVDFAYKVGNKIATTHISDCDFTNEKHWFPGVGLIRWHDLYKALEEVGYEGVWMYELGFGDRKPEDFVRNAHEIAEGKPITV